MLCETCGSIATQAPAGVPPQGVDRLAARWAYEGLPRELVLELKLRHARSAAIPLGRGVAEVLRRVGCRGSAMTWVPGRPHEERIRGFDHAGAIAREASVRLGLPLISPLRRRKETIDQTGLSRMQRRRNVLGAYSSVPISGWVALVDDVVTSGATAQACAEALKAAGCQGVEVFTACRA